MKWVWAILMSVGVAAGCSSSVQQTDGSSVQFKWLQGELKTALSFPLSEVEGAARAAFDELRMVGVDGSSDTLKGQLRALMADGTRVHVKLKAAGTENTFITIKVGTIGDKPISLQILRHVERELATPHPELDAEKRR